MAVTVQIGRVKFMGIVEDGFRQSLKQAEDLAREKAPMGRSHPSADRRHGTLKESVDSRVTLVSSLRIEGVITADGKREGNTHSHARWVHEGRPAIGPKFMRIPFVDAIVETSHVKASTPNPFLEDAVIEVYGRNAYRRTLL